MTATNGYLLAAATLLAFAALGVTSPGARVISRDAYLTARASQGTLRLAASLFASGMGVWILFVPTEVGYFVGIAGVVGYAVAAAAPLGVLSWFGPRVREALPGGSTLSGWLRSRFGRSFQRYVAAVSVFYMAMFVTAELTAIGSAFAALTKGNPDVVIVAVALATAAYTAYGGLPASLRTDRWQAIMILGLISVAGVAIVGEVGDIGENLGRGSGQIGRAGLETAATLIIAVTAANLFHQGYWQRLWAATDDTTVRRATRLAAVLTLVTMLAVGTFGMIAAGSGVTPEEGAPLFALLRSQPIALLAVVLVLALALVASSVDTLQNGIVALFVDGLTDRPVSLNFARLATILLTIPATLVAVQGFSVLRLFLMADLVAAATIAPILLGFTGLLDGRGAITGAVSGLLAVVVIGWATRGSLGDGFDLLTIADGALELGPFLWAPATATVVSLLVSRASGTRTLTAPADDTFRQPAAPVTE